VPLPQSGIKAEMNKMEYTTKKIGWENENNDQNVVLLRRKDRETEQMPTNSIVKVTATKGAAKISALAIISVQFREFIADENVTTVNTKLAKALGIELGEKIEISKEVTESEHDAFIAEIQERQRQGFQNFLGRLSGGG
jgi:hypothetical protein